MGGSASCQCRARDSSSRPLASLPPSTSAIRIGAPVWACRYAPSLNDGSATCARLSERRANQLSEQAGESSPGAGAACRFRFLPTPSCGRPRIACARRCSTGLRRRSSDARCLDLFAGSGALAVRGAVARRAQVVCVERDREVVRHCKTRQRPRRRDSKRSRRTPSRTLSGPASRVQHPCFSIPPMRRTC